MGKLDQQLETEYEYMVRISHFNENGKPYTRREVYIGGELRYSICMEMNIAEILKHEPIREFEESILGFKERESRKDIITNGSEFSRFLREAWVKLTGKNFEFPAELLDICFKDSLLSSESSMYVKIVRIGSDGDKSALISTRLIDESEFLKLVENSFESVDGDIESTRGILINQLELRTACGNKVRKNFIFQLSSDNNIFHTS